MPMLKNGKGNPTTQAFSQQEGQDQQNLSVHDIFRGHIDLLPFTTLIARSPAIVIYVSKKHPLMTMDGNCSITRQFL